MRSSSSVLPLHTQKQCTDRGSSWGSSIPASDHRRLLDPPSGNVTKPLVQWRRKQFASGGHNTGVKRRPKIYVPPSLFSCAPQYEGHNDCLLPTERQLKWWSRERGNKSNGALVYTHILILTAFLVRPLQESHGCITSKMIKYSYETLYTELK